MTTFIMTDFDLFRIPLTTHPNVCATLYHHIDWFCITYPLLSSFRETMTWSRAEGETSIVYLQTKLEGCVTIQVTNSVYEDVFDVPKMNTYSQLAELIRLILSVDTIRFRIHHLGSLWELRHHELTIHPSCHRIQLSVTEDEFYILLDLDPSDWMKSVNTN